MKNRGLYITLFVLTVLLLALPALQQQFKWFKFEPLRGATVATPKPMLNFSTFMDGSFQKQEDQYLAENIGFREPLVRYYNQLSWSLFHKTYCQDVVVGKGQWLYGKKAVSDHFRQLSGMDASKDEELMKKLDREIDRLKRVQTLLDERGTKLFVLVCPSKDLIYPEYLPDSRAYVMGDGMRAVEYVPRAFAEKGINFIDMGAWFQQIKDKVDYPLFPKTGTHWSNVACMHVCDTLFHYMEHLTGKNMPNIKVGSAYLSEPVNPDTDLEKIMNLIQPIQPNQNYYAKVDVVPDTASQRLRLVTIGDSFFWNIAYTMPMDSLFSSYPYWYYFNTVYYDSNHNNVKELNIVEELDNADLVMIVVTSHHLYDFNMGFLSRVERALSNPHPEIVESIMLKMKADPVWYENLVEKAEKKGESLEEVMRDDALWLIEQNPEKYLSGDGME